MSPAAIRVATTGGTIWRVNLAAAGTNREMVAFMVGSRVPSSERWDLTATLRQQLGKSGTILGNSAARSLGGHHRERELAQYEAVESCGFRPQPCVDSHNRQIWRYCFARTHGVLAAPMISPSGRLSSIEDRSPPPTPKLQGLPCPLSLR